MSGRDNDVKFSNTVTRFQLCRLRGVRYYGRKACSCVWPHASHDRVAHRVYIATQFLSLLLGDLHWPLVSPPDTLSEYALLTLPDSAAELAPLSANLGNECHATDMAARPYVFLHTKNSRSLTRMHRATVELKETRPPNRGYIRQLQLPAPPDSSLLATPRL